MRVVKRDRNGFIAMFDTETGRYVRTGVIKDGKMTEEDAFMAYYPELIDIGVMGNCVHGKRGLCVKAGIQCYQNGMNANNENMRLEDYMKIIDESKGKTFQVALGGAGDVDQHNRFEELLRYDRENNIVPNYTSSGYGITKDIADISKKYCGAVAISMYSRLRSLEPVVVCKKSEDNEKYTYNDEENIPVKFTLGNKNKECYINAQKYIINNKVYEIVDMKNTRYSKEETEYEMFRVFNEREENVYTYRAVELLMDAGVTTNIHYVLSKETIEEAIIRLKYNGFPKGINAVVFLLHKPVGLGRSESVLDINDCKVKEFFELVDKGGYEYKIGFDSCSIPGIINLNSNIDTISCDTCEGGRFSMYIDANMVAMPCSFDNQELRWGVSLKGRSIQGVWESKEFEEFREYLKCSCCNCKDREQCMGGCPIRREIVLCNRNEKDLY